jgi:prevent-host-death family protein
MREYCLSNAKALLSQAVDEANRGEEVIITRHGHPIARIVPFEDKGKRQLGTARGLVEFLPGWQEPITMEDLIGK